MTKHKSTAAVAVAAIVTSIGTSPAFAGIAPLVTIRFAPILPIPALDSIGLVVLALGLALVGFRLLRSGKGAGGNLVVGLAFVGAIAAGAGSVKMMADAYAAHEGGHHDLYLTPASGGVVVVDEQGRTTVHNSTEDKQRVVDIIVADDCVLCGPGSGQPYPCGTGNGGNGGEVIEVIEIVELNGGSFNGGSNGGNQPFLCREEPGTVLSPNDTCDVIVQCAAAP